MGGLFLNFSFLWKKKVFFKNVYCLICVLNVRKFIYVYGMMILNILKVMNLKNKNYFLNVDWFKLGIIVFVLMCVLNNKKND